MIREQRYACLLATLLFFGCENEIIIAPAGSSSASSGQGGAAGQAGSGGTAGAGGEGGSAGSGGGIVGVHGPGAHNMVSSGKVSTSTSYKLVWTMGQSTQNQAKMSTTKYRLQGGLAGANGSLP